MLDLECFTFLHRAMESSVSPILVLATNRAKSLVRGSDGIISSHGIPSDLLDRLAIIRMLPYTMKEIGEIIETRARVEGVSLTDDAVRSLAQIGFNTSLRYAVQLLSPAGQLAKVSKQSQVDDKLIKEASQLFQDSGNSARILRDRDAEFLK